MDLYEHMKQYQVQASTLEEFLEAYTKRHQHSGRGAEYVKTRIQSHQADINKYGYTFITHHDSNTGTIASWYPREAKP